VSDSSGKKKIAPYSHTQTLDVIEIQRQAFIRKFGREPGPDDPIFFDPEQDTPQPVSSEKMREQMVVAMRAGGIRPEIVYAYEETGLIASPGGHGNMTPHEQAEYHMAINAYFQHRRPH
jgi:hypothetical protein